MSSNQPTKLPTGYYVVKGPKGHAVFSDIPHAPSWHEQIPVDEPDKLLVRITPWRATRYAAITYFAINSLGKKDIHDAP